MSTSSRYVLFALLGGVFFIGAVYLVLQFDILTDAQEDALDNSITFTVDSSPSEEPVDLELTKTYVDADYGFSLELLQGWAVSTTGYDPDIEEEKVLHVSFTEQSSLEDIPLEEWDGLGDGYGQTVDSFADDSTAIENEDIAPISVNGATALVVELENGYRAKLYTGGGEGTTLVRSYSLYVDDVRMTLTFDIGNTDGLFDASLNVESSDNSTISPTAPLEIAAVVSELDAIVQTLNIDDFSLAE